MSLATGGSADCLTNMTCNEENTSVGQAMADEFKGDHPAAASGVVDSASGALSVNPITAATNAVGATDTGQCGNSSSWWYHGGQAAMILTDLWAGTGAFAGPLSETEAVGKGSTLFGRGGGLLNSNDAVRLGEPPRVWCSADSWAFGSGERRLQSWDDRASTATSCVAELSMR
ncbi:MAG: hypothetical protein U0Q07_06725 [Acidimicrobiales bacterium]